MVTSNPLDDLKDLLSIGDVVAARIYDLAPNWGLILTDVDDDEVIKEPPSLLPGGPPWISLPTFEVAEEVQLAAPGSRPPTSITKSDDEAVEIPRQGRKLTEQLLLSIESKKAETAELRERILELGSHLEQAERDREYLRDQLQAVTRDFNITSHELAKTRSKLRKTRTNSSESHDGPTFADPELGFRHLVMAQWANRVPIGEQLSKPLPVFQIGEKFLDSLRSIQGITDVKVADVVVELVTGLATFSEGRDIHRLREGLSGTSKPLQREDGAICWRANIQTGSPSARRIHYWVLPDGSIELSRVVLHDDFNP